MKVKDFSPFVDEKGEVTLAERIRGTLKYGSSWFADVQAQEIVIDRLQNALDDSYTLLRNHTLQGLEVPIPLILIGPTGIQVTYTSSLKGIYQVNGEQWRVMGSNSRNFRPARPNLINRSLLFSRAVERHLERCGIVLPPVESVIIFTDPGMHVDTQRPATRIVMVDALDRYAASLAQGERKVSPEDVHKLAHLLVNPPPQALPGGAEMTEEDRLIEKALTSRGYSTSPSDGPQEFDLPLLGPVRFTNRQWLVLGALVLVNILILTIFIIVALSAA